MRVIRTGYGFGKRNIGRLNALRVFLGEEEAPDDMDEVLLLTTNIDNSTPEQLGYAAERLMKAGAYDVAYIPLMMKKWRPAQMLQVVAPLTAEAILVQLIFQLTGTTGVRRQICRRHVMRRSFFTRQTQWGPVRLKTNTWRHISKIYPEHDDIAQIAEQADIALTDAVALLRLPDAAEKSKEDTHV